MEKMLNQEKKLKNIIQDLENLKKNLSFNDNKKIDEIKIKLESLV